MSRNKLKSPFFKYTLNIKRTKKRWIKLFHKNFTIMPRDIDYIYNIYNGHTFFKVKITKDMVGYKFGEFINTRKKSLSKKIISKKKK